MTTRLCNFLAGSRVIIMMLCVTKVNGKLVGFQLDSSSGLSSL